MWRLAFSFKGTYAERAAVSGEKLSDRKTVSSYDYKIIIITIIITATILIINIDINKVKFKVHLLWF